MGKNTNDIVITSAVRSPIGSYKGALKNLKADQIGSICIKEILNRSNLSPDEVDEVILGQVLTAGEGQNSARQAAINAFIPNTKPAHLVNQVCGSGLRAIISGYQLIKLADADIVITGGQENMSRSPHTIFYRAEKKLDKKMLVDTMINDGLIDAFNKYHMGITAENVAKQFNISRDDQDNFALDSQKKALDAITHKKFDQDIKKLNTLPYNWNDIDSAREDADYIYEFYEEIVDYLTIILNQYNDLNLEKKYWKTLIGPWVYYFVTKYYDHYKSVTAVLNTKKNLNINITGEYYIPNTYLGYNKLIIQHSILH